MFVVFGANGNTGSVVAETLLAKGKKVRVVARDAKKVEALTKKGAEFFQADLEKGSDVVAALKGAEGAYVLLPPSNSSQDFLARQKTIADNFAKGIAENHVAHVVVLSSTGAQLPSGTGPIVSAHRAEELFQKVSGTKFTFIRAAYFMENILANAHPIKADGVLPVFGGGEGYAFDMIATKDIGDTAATALLTTPKENEWIELVGPKTYSFNDAAAEATKIVGKDVKTVVLPFTEVVPTLTKFGFSENMAGLYREMLEAFGSGKVAWEGKGRRVQGKVTLGEVLRGGLS